MPVPGVAGQSPVDGRRLPVASLVVFNPLSWERSDLVRCRVALRPGQAHGLRVLDPTGAPVPSQLAAVERHGGGSLKAAELLFIARQVPPLGYRAFTLVPTWESGDPPAPARAPASYESHFYRVLFAHGGLNSLYDKALKRELLQPEQLLGGEVLLRRPGSDGPGAFYRLSRDRPWWIAVEHGPVRHRFQWEQATPHGRVHACPLSEPQTWIWKRPPEEPRLRPRVSPGVPAPHPQRPHHLCHAHRGGAGQPDDYHQPPGSSIPPGVPRWVTVGDGRTTLSPGDAMEATEVVGRRPTILQPVLRSRSRETIATTASRSPRTGGWERGWRAGQRQTAAAGRVLAGGRGPRRCRRGASCASRRATRLLLRKSEDDDSLLLRCREMLEASTRAVGAVLAGALRLACRAGGGRAPLRVEGRRVRLRLGAHAVTTVRLSLRAAAP